MEKNLFYIGKDGRYYSDSADLAIADAEWKRQNLQFKGKDGRYYSDSADLSRANEDYIRRNFPKKEKDRFNFIRG